MVINKSETGRWKENIKKINMVKTGTSQVWFLWLSENKGILYCEVFHHYLYMYKFIDLNRGFGFIWCTSLHKRKDEKSQAGLFNNSWCICFCSMTNGCILPTHCHQLSVLLLCSMLDTVYEYKSRKQSFEKWDILCCGTGTHPFICPLVILEGEPAPALEFVIEMYESTYFICFRP